MEDETQDGSEVLETTEEETTTEETQEETEDVEALKKKNAQLYARAKKAEGFELVDGQWVKKQDRAETSNTEEQLSPKDALLLAKANVDIEDVDEVTSFAKFRKITIEDALKNPTLKAILKDRAEERATAAATQTKGPRGGTKITGEVLLSRAHKGDLPEGDADIERLAEARMAAKKQKK